MREAYDRASFFIDCFLLYTQVIRAFCGDHACLAVFDLTDICIVDLNSLVLCQRIGAIFFTVYSNTDCPMTAFIDKRHFSPHRKCKNKDSSYKYEFFFLQGYYSIFL